MLKPFLHTSAKDLAVIEGLQELFIETEPIIDEKKIFVELNLRKVKSKF